MITISTQETIDGYNSLYEFECPECGKCARFYSIATIYCIYCKRKFPFVARNLIKKEEERVKYHKSDDNNNI